MTPVAESLSYRSLFSGLDVEVPLLDNKQVVYVNFDNAASTPAMLPVLETVDRFLTYYSSVHRGTGFKSQISTCWIGWARILGRTYVYSERIRPRRSTSWRDGFRFGMDGMLFW